MKPYDMAFPANITEACDLLEEHPESRIIAGGTALTVLMKEGVYFPDLLINLRPLADELEYVREAEGSVRIGALTTLREMERSEVVQENYPTVVDCLEEIAGVRVRNSATIGGHLAHADANLDLPPVLAGLDAEVVLTDGRSDRRLPIDDFLLGYYETALEEGELISAIELPLADPERRGVYLKHRYFSEVDWPCVGVAAFGTGGSGGVSDVQVLLNSVSDTPVLRVEGIDDAVDGTLTADGIESVKALAVDQADPVDDIRGSAAYKERMVGVFTGRALERLQGGVAA